MRNDLSNFDEKKAPVPAAPKRHTTKLKKRSKSKPHVNSEEELQKTFKLMMENESEESIDSRSGRMVARAEAMHMTHEDGVRPRQEAPETRGPASNGIASESEPLLVHHGADKSPTGEDAVTLNTSKFSSRMLVNQKSTFTVNEGQGELHLIQPAPNQTNGTTS